MDISHESAMRIVTEMSSIIHHDVNMMDGEGMIIASTDPSRIGTFHGGARELLQSHLDELIVTEDDQFVGARAGINLPLIFEGAVVGVIGITGSRDEVQQYGQIIKKMTEILLLDSWAGRQKQMKAAVWNQYIEEWLFSSEEQINGEFVERGMKIGIDVKAPRQTLIVALSGGKNSGDAREQELLSQAEKQLRDCIRGEKENIYYKLPFKYVCLLSRRPREKLRDLALQIGEALRRGCGLTPFIGVDEEVLEYRRAHRSYVHADKALKAGLLAGDPLVFYDDISLEIFINEVPPNIRQDFIDKVFRDCGAAERQELMDFLAVYYQHEGSLQALSKALFLHKNTVQYKLKKIQSLTRLDPRSIKNAAVFAVAIAFNGSLKEKQAAQMLHL